MKAIFLSDAHIRDHRDPHLPPLLAFLDRLRGQVERLYVVGDLFDTWFGFPRAVFDVYVPLLGALDAVKRSGARIVYVTGNHDFEMGSFFEEVLDARVHDTETTVTEDGRRAFVAHGDMANRTDRGYRLVRAILRAGLTRWVGRQLPPAWVWGVSHVLRKTCHGRQTRKYRQFERIFNDYADAKFQAGHDTVILGHMHVPQIRQEGAGNGSRTFVNLGDWMEHRTFLRWTDGRLELKRWTWPEAEERDFVAPVV